MSLALIAVALATPGIAGEAQARKPRIEVRATYRPTLTPVRVVAVAELVGGEDTEEFYCAGLEWDWGDGNRSFQESDCDPWEPGMEIDRFFAARHAYHRPGVYQVTITLERAGSRVAVGRAVVRVAGHQEARLRVW
jgi:hypothetical protein